MCGHVYCSRRLLMCVYVLYTVELKIVTQHAATAYIYALVQTGVKEKPGGTRGSACCCWRSDAAAGRDRVTHNLYIYIKRTGFFSYIHVCVCACKIISHVICFERDVYLQVYMLTRLPIYILYTRYSNIIICA